MSEVSFIDVFTRAQCLKVMYMFSSSHFPALAGVVAGASGPQVGGPAAGAKPLDIRRPRLDRGA